MKLLFPSRLCISMCTCAHIRPCLCGPEFWWKVTLSLVFLTQDGGKQLLEGMSDNKTVLEFDLRLSDIAQESEYLIGQALCANREAARQRALNPSHLMSPVTAKGPESPVG